MGIRESLKKCQPIQVIRTFNRIIGADTDDDPLRPIVQYWTTEGELLDECDSYLEAAIEKRRKKTSSAP